MSVVLIVSRLHSLSGIQEDFTQNSWVFEEGAEPDPLVAAGTAINKLDDFYLAIGGYYGSSVSRVSMVHEHLVYDLAAELDTPGSGTGSPILVENFSIPVALASAGLPSEVATVLSFHAALGGAPVEVGGTRPRSRRHGRVFLGPLNIQCMNEEAGFGETRPRAAFRTVVADAAEAMIVGTGNDWSVWSRVDGTVREVVGGWIDNAFDTQRRRGVAATGRTLFP